MVNSFFDSPVVVGREVSKALCMVTRDVGLQCTRNTPYALTTGRHGRPQGGNSFPLILQQHYREIFEESLSMHCYA